MDISKLLLNPARLRILQYANLQGKATAQQIANALPDIPRATVYHHVKLLEEHGLLRLSEERKVRGAVEKVLEPTAPETLFAHDDFTAVASAALVGLLGELTGYLAQPEADMMRDRVFLNEGYFMLTDTEYDMLMHEIGTALKKAADLPPAPKRRLRKLTLVSTLPEQGATNGYDTEEEQK